MKLTSRIAIFAAGAVAVGAIGYASAGQADPAAPAQPAHPAVAGTTSPTPATNTFVPITPCRIVDTRHGGGPLAKKSARSFYAYGSSGISGQGGKSGGCGIPTTATALSVAVSSTQSAASGYLTAYPTGVSVPLAATLSFRKGVPLTSSTDVPLGAGTAKVLNVYASQKSQVIVDVVGYYSEQLSVSVESDATIVSQSNHIVGVAHSSTGLYTVTFDRSVTGCSANSSASGGVGYSTSAFVSGTQAFVYTWRYPGNVVTPSDMYWQLVVAC